MALVKSTLRSTRGHGIHRRYGKENEISILHGAVVADVEEVLLPLASDVHMAALHPATDLVSGVPHELCVVADLVEVVGGPVAAVLKQEGDSLGRLFSKFLPYQK